MLKIEVPPKWPKTGGRARTLGVPKNTTFSTILIKEPGQLYRSVQKNHRKSQERHKSAQNRRTPKKGLKQGVGLEP
jgi:hypothetical protein